VPKCPINALFEKKFYPEKRYKEELNTVLAHLGD
jgi:hypothetical protein